MQGITVALSSEGINFFVESLFTSNGDVAKAINGVNLADYTVTVQYDIFFTTGQDEAADCSNVKIQLSNGSISSFTPIFPNLQQEEKGVFQLVFSSDAFNANYSWLESYTRQNQQYEDNPDNPNDPGQWVNDGNSYPVSTPFHYSAGVGSLATTTTFTFTFDSSKNVWALPITSITAVANNPVANIPGASILQNQDQPGCVQSHVDAATEASIDQGINFQSALQNAFGNYLTSIPASGQLFQDPKYGTIIFTFGLGDSPLTFPNDQGLTVGVTGISTYTPVGKPPQQYPGTPPANLPIPSTAPISLFGGIPASEAQIFDAMNINAIKADFAKYSVPSGNPTQPPQYPLTNPTVTVITPGSEWLVVDNNSMKYQVQLNTNTLEVFGLYHLQMYVSDYAINGLYWAFFMAQQLNVTVTPLNADDPDILKVRTWDTSIRELQKYAALNMSIVITPVQAPTVEFQTVYLFTQDVMNSLQADPNLASIWTLISGMAGNVYPNQALLEQDLVNIYGVDSQYFTEIEKKAGTPGAAVSHDIQFNVTIDGAPLINGQLPYMTFTVNRIDVLENLGLGVANNAQTLTFGFNPGTNSVVVTFNASNFLTKDVIGDFGTQIWPQACETPYDHALNHMGQTGTPLPMMQGFQFLFDVAQVSIQQGYIGILSNVEFKG